MTKKHKKILQVLLFFLLFNIFSNQEIKAQGDTVANLETLAVSLIIDKSGSMNATDPSKMRETAANIFIDLLSPEDNLGIISFSTEAVEVQPMTNIGETGKAAIKGNLVGKLDADGDTDYQKAFQRAYEQLNSIDDENVKKVIVFLTDGNPDPDPKRLAEPAFMDNYMNGFWDTVKNIGLEGYPVYTVGFGALDKGVMDRIALETKGQSKMFTAPEEAAVEFFNIISQLKNRNLFINENHVLEGEKIIEFKMDEYVSQMTFVVTNTPGEFGLELIPPEGVALGDNTNVESSANYSLITMNQEDKELSGTWKIRMTGTSQVSFLGAKDLFVKIWISNPITNSQHSIDDPINISATMTGADSDNLKVDGLMMINGVQSLKPVIMTKVDDIYSGVYNDTKAEGDYEIILNVRDGENIISTTSAQVHVKVLPTITADISSIEDGFRLGEKRVLSSSLELGLSSLRESNELVLEYYNLIANYAGVGEVVFSLKDDGITENGDAKAGDGRFSTNVIFDQEGAVNLTLQVRGTYKGEIFILEKNIGDTVIHVPGSVTIGAVKDSIIALKGESIGLEIKIKSTSSFEEVLELSVPEELGTLDFSRILLGAQEEKIVTLNFIPVADLNTDSFNIPLSVKVENGLTILNTSNIQTNVDLMTKTEKFLSIVSSKAPIILMILGLLLVIILLIVLIGLILYRKNFKPYTYVTGMLSYFKIKDDPEDYFREDKESINLWKYEKSQIVITFDPKKENSADIYIPGSKYIYDIIFEKRFDKSRFKFIDGYRSMKHKIANNVFLRTTEPGILIVEKNIYTNLELSGNIIFNSGEFIFRYTGKKFDDVVELNAKDILEGKM